MGVNGFLAGLVAIPVRLLTREQGLDGLGRKFWAGSGILCLLLSGGGKARAETAPREGAPDNRGRLSADFIELSTDGQHAIADGNVRFRYREVEVYADRLELDRERDLLTGEGQVRVIWRGQTVHGEELRFNLHTREYFMREATSALSPDFFGPGVAEPVYVLGREIEGREQEHFLAREVTVTTCDPAKPVYKITSRLADVYPGRRLTLRGAKLYVFGAPLLAVSKLVLPLRPFRRRQFPFVPEVGRNDVEGWFLKTRYHYESGARGYGTVFLDLLEKQGLRTGAQHNYAVRGGQGMVDVRYAFETNSLNARLSHQQEFSRAWRGNLSVNYSQNSLFTRTIRQANADLRLSHTTRREQSNWSLRLQRSDGRESRYATFNQSLTWGGGIRANLRANYTRRPVFGAGAGVHDEQLDTTIQFRGDRPNFTWELRDQRRFDPDGDTYTQDDFFPHTDTLPRLTFRTTGRQLKWNLGPRVNTRLALDLGEFREIGRREGKPVDVRVFRTNFDFYFNASRVPLGARSWYDANLRFSQSFYSDNTAQYVLGGRLGLTSYFARGWRLRVNYNYQQPRGYSPLSRFDFRARQNSLSLDTLYAVKDRVELALSSGYDARLSRFRYLTVRLRAIPSLRFRFELNTSYDFHGRGLGTVRSRFYYDLPERLQWSGSLYYDPRRGKLGRVSSLLGWQLSRRWRIDNALEYDGRRNKVTFNDLLLTYDLDCVQLLGIYSKQRGEWRIDVNITAFPRALTFFGVGQFGQQFDTSLGAVY
ncbi:MAG TPA: LPS-assembly protein LptD [Armatimonadetes bacterium]|nr:LPS-assembly protein LptD [Armatimonadota bacterium]